MTTNNMHIDGYAKKPSCHFLRLKTFLYQDNMCLLLSTTYGIYGYVGSLILNSVHALFILGVLIFSACVRLLLPSNIASFFSS